jgi:hypothetical protein
MNAPKRCLFSQTAREICLRWGSPERNPCQIRDASGALMVLCPRLTPAYEAHPLYLPSAAALANPLAAH